MLRGGMRMDPQPFRSRLPGIGGTRRGGDSCPSASRRRILAAGAAGVGAAGLRPLGCLAAAAGPAAGYRAAVIGRTGGGDYGHGCERIFAGVPGVSVEAIADADPAGLEQAAVRCGAKRRYADYREMLERERPDLVCIAPRQPDCHREMALAAIEVCRGIFIEKPFTETPADADAILAAAERRGVKIQVAHNRRYTDGFIRSAA